jgi:hypothetical protein|tara:strand:- start:695 stop:814 length:120 start_codon:yes stop_codon:yes gene_type:complete
MDELKRISMDLLITLIYEIKKNKEVILTFLVGFVLGKII